MVFSSLAFLVFFAIVFAAYQTPISWAARKLIVLIASYIFYAAWNPPFLGLLVGSTIVDWIVAKRIAAANEQARRRAWLAVSLIFNLGILTAFKYGGFLLTNVAWLANVIGVTAPPAGWNVILPVGISFYTFLTLSYTIDVYRRELEPGRSFLDFAFFVTFFPHLVAGPILRAAQFLPQCVSPRRGTADQIGWGLTLITVGLVEKVIFADSLLAPVAEAVFGSAPLAGPLDALAGTLAFSGQIFFDFAGYSSCAIGTALCLGFDLPDNFRFPYAAVGFSDFWRRWHISLSTWLRDYLYIPLGGNRNGSAHTHRNLIITMLLGGLWHGASWRFVVWGGLHGLYLIAERWIRARFGRAGRPLPAVGQLAIALVTYAFVCLAWVFFRANSATDALHLISTMLFGGPDRLVIGTMETATVFVVITLLIASHWGLRNTTLEDRWRTLPWWSRSLVLATLLMCLIFASGDSRDFIYFQF